MRWLSDEAVQRLRAVADAPDLSGTRYELLRPIARGGMGTVYLVHDRELDREVALKVLSLPTTGEGEAARLLREARIIARLEHPGIVPVHDLGRLPDGRIFYVMKRVEGRRLDELAAEPQSLAERLRVFLRVCEPVAFAHSRGVLHRDLKPENIMVGPFGEVLVLDWGVAKLLSAGDDPERLEPGNPTSAGGTGVGSVLGTRGYMSSEQERGEGDLDARSDVYSLGALLRFLAGGGQSAPAGLPRAVQAIAAKAMARDRDDRYRGVPELSDDVVRFLQGQRVEAHAETLPEGAWRLLKTHRTAVILLSAYAVVRVLLLVFFRP